MPSCKYDDSFYIDNDYLRRLNEVKDKFITQQESPIRDSKGRRWCQCIFCKEIKEEARFSKIGVENPNLGECRMCSREKSQ